MHGIIFSELKKFVDGKLGPDSWTKLMKESGLKAKVYLSTQEYPDAEINLLVSTASRLTGKNPQAILEEFGEFIVPDLVNIYGSLIKPAWRTLDLIEHTEETIHKVVRIKNPGAHPPELKCTRPSPKEVVITYNSARKMCAVAKGIARGIAKHYREQIMIHESSCMLRGNAVCILSIRTA